VVQAAVAEGGLAKRDQATYMRTTRELSNGFHWSIPSLSKDRPLRRFAAIELSGEFSFRVCLN
jgi:hypothetical protein